MISKVCKKRSLPDNTSMEHTDILEDRTEITAQAYHASSVAQFGGRLSDGTVRMVQVEVPYGGNCGKAHAIREAILISQRMMERGFSAGTVGGEETTVVSTKILDAGKGRQR